MRVAVFGATSHIGTSAVRALVADKAVDRVVGIARHAPAPDPFGMEWREVDVERDDLLPALRGADVVVHLSWVSQPAHHERALFRTNVEGTRRILDAVVAAGAQGFVYASTVGVYAPAPGQHVDEDHPTSGVPHSAYSAQRVAVERMIDRFEAEHPPVRVVRIRPSFVLEGEAATDVRVTSLGHRVLQALLGRGRPPVVPLPPGLALQVVHADDVADAVRRAVVGSVTGAFNVAGEPVLTAGRLAEALGGRPLPLSPGLLRTVVRTGFALRLLRTEPGWVELALRCPLLDTARAREELGWEPSRPATGVLREFLDGLADGRTGPTPHRRDPVGADRVAAPTASAVPPA